MEATVASNVVMVVDKTLVIAISGTWTASVRLLRALATSWRAATNAVVVGTLLGLFAVFSSQKVKGN